MKAEMKKHLAMIIPNENPGGGQGAGVGGDVTIIGDIPSAP